MVGLGVVGEHPLDDDPLLGVPGDCATQKRGAVAFARAREDLAVGEPGVVVDGDVQMLPTRPPGAVDAVAADPLADLPEAAEFLRVHVQELTWPLALVAHARVTTSPREPRAAGPAQHLADGRGGTLDDRGDHGRTCPELVTPAQDLLLRLSSEPARLPPRSRGSIDKRLPAARPVAAPEPIPGRATSAAGGRGRLRALTGDDQRHDPAPRLNRETHPPRRAHSIMHLGLLRELGLGRPQGSPEARTQSAVSQVCG